MFLCELERAFEQQLGLIGIMTKGRELSLTEQQLTHDLGRTSSGHFFGCHGMSGRPDQVVEIALGDSSQCASARQQFDTFGIGKICRLEKREGVLTESLPY